MKPQQQSIQSTPIDKKAVISGFNRAASSYDSADVLQREVASRLLERLQWIKIEPKIILDLGSGTGSASIELAKLYPDAKIICLDIAEKMLQFSQKKILSISSKQNFLSKLKNSILRSTDSHNYKFLCADAEQLPLIDNSVDLIFSNLAIQWSNNTSSLFTELHRVLKAESCLLFSTFGTDTLFELKQSWEKVSQHEHVNQFVDLHDLGDAMLQSGFIDPVMDCEHITMEYTEIMDLLKDLKQIGAQNHLNNRSKGLITQAKLTAMKKNYEQFRQQNNKYPASYEVVYGHAWGRALKIKTNPAKFIPIMSQ